MTTAGELQQDENKGNEQVFDVSRCFQTRRICERTPCYAAIDTKATQTFCSRDLAQKLFGQWYPDDHQKYRMLNGQLIKYEAIKQRLKLKKLN